MQQFWSYRDPTNIHSKHITLANSKQIVLFKIPLIFFNLSLHLSSLTGKVNMNWVVSSSMGIMWTVWCIISIIFTILFFQYTGGLEHFCLWEELIERSKLMQSFWSYGRGHKPIYYTQTHSLPSSLHNQIKTDYIISFVDTSFLNRFTQKWLNGRGKKSL